MARKKITKKYKGQPVEKTITVRGKSIRVKVVTKKGKKVIQSGIGKVDKQMSGSSQYNRGMKYSKTLGKDGKLKLVSAAKRKGEVGTGGGGGTGSSK